MSEEFVRLTDPAAAAVVGVLTWSSLHGFGDVLLPVTFLVSAVDLVVLAVPVYVAVSVLLGEHRSVASPGVSWFAAAVAVASAVVLWTLNLILSAGPPAAGTVGLLMLVAGYAGTAFVGIRRVRESLADSL